MQCELCTLNNEEILYQTDLYRIIAVNDQYYPGFVRVILNQHVKELTDLSKNEAHILCDIIFEIEIKMREFLNPDKVNIASLGNVTPHLHWHIVPRFIDDRHFPNPIWGKVVNQNYHPAKKLQDAFNQFKISLKTGLV